MRYNRGIFLSIAAIAAFLSLAARATVQDHSGHEGRDMAANTNTNLQADGEMR